MDNGFTKAQVAKLVDYVARSWVRRGFGIRPGFFDAAIDAVDQCAGEAAMKIVLFDLVSEYEIPPLRLPKHVEGLDRF